MSKEYACDYVLVRYVPNPLRDEARNIGVILRSIDGRYAGGRFLPSIKKLSDLQTDDEDLAILEDYVHDLQSQLAPFQSGKGNLFLRSPFFDADYLDEMWKKLNGKFQFSRPRAAISASPDVELGKLFELFVVPEKGSLALAAAEKDSLMQGVLAEFEGRSLRPRIGRQYPVEVKKQKLVFSFGYKPFRQEKREVVVELVDLRAESFLQRVRAFAPTSVKIEIAKSHRSALEAFCVVRRPSRKSDVANGLELELETLRRHADGVFDFDISGQREKLLQKIEKDLRV